MTNRIALVLACLIFAAICGDVAFNSGTASIFLMKKLVILIEYVEFWR